VPLHAGFLLFLSRAVMEQHEPLARELFAKAAARLGKAAAIA